MFVYPLKNVCLPDSILVDEHDNGAGLGFVEPFDDAPIVLVQGVAADFLRGRDADPRFFRHGRKRGDAFFAVFTLGGYRADVRPLEHLGDLDHRLGLEIVRRNDARKILEPRLVGQLGRSGSVTNLRNLKKSKLRIFEAVDISLVPHRFIVHSNKLLKFFNC